MNILIQVARVPKLLHKQLGWGEVDGVKWKWVGWDGLPGLCVLEVKRAGRGWAGFGLGWTGLGGDTTDGRRTDELKGWGWAGLGWAVTRRTDDGRTS